MGKLLTFLRTEIPSWQLFSEEAKTLFYTSTAEQFDTVNHFYLICLCILRISIFYCLRRMAFIFR